MHEPASFPLRSLAWATHWANVTGWNVSGDVGAKHLETLSLSPPGDRHLQPYFATVTSAGRVIIERQCSASIDGFPTTATTTVGIFDRLEAGLLELCGLPANGFEDIGTALA